MMQIQGAGGGGGTPTEAPNTARSIQRAAIVDVLSEGPIGGLVNGLKSVFLDGVPVENADGTRNVQDFALTMQLGGPTTEGLLVEHGFNAVESEVSVGVQVYQAVPVVRSITDPTVDTVRVTIGVPQLTQATDEGDLNGAAFEWAIEVQCNGGGYVERYRATVAEKVTSTYLRAVRIDLAALGPAPWDIKVRRITPDSADSKLQNAFYWTSYTRITTVKMAYRHSAAAGAMFDARNFQNIPGRHYDLMGYCEWEVPSNFDPIARTYTGTWNGQFKLAWTNDPAWVYYGLATNRRFGLGAYVWAKPDKWVLYELSQWCNGLVPDGRGGMEPRYTINTQLTQQVEALTLLQDIAAIFRGVTVYSGGSISTAWDAPSEPVALYTPANVVDGLFVYSDGSVAAKKSSCTAWYNDISQFCKSVPVTWDDPELVAKYGMRPMPITLMGCTSPSQALRQAKWALYTTEHGDQLCSFVVGSEGELGRLGQVFAVADPAESGERLGGRVLASSTAAAVAIDSAVELLAGETYTLHLTVQDPVDPQRLAVVQRTVTNAPGAHAVLQLSQPLDAAPPADAVWVLEANTVAPTLWRYWAIKPQPSDDGATQYAVTGIKHDPSKWAAIEQNQPYKARPVRRLPDAPTKPINLALTEVVAQDGQTWRSSLVVGWEATSPGLNYLVSWRYAAGTWVELPATRSQSADIGPLNAGTVEVWVRATDVKGSPPSEALQGSIQILGNTKAAADVLALGLVNTSKGVVAAWSKSTDFDYSATELRIDGATPEAAAPLATVAATSHNLGWPEVGLRTLWARHLRRGGPAGAWSYAQLTYNGPQPLLDALDGRITQQQLDAALNTSIEEAEAASLAALEGLGLEIAARTAGDADLAKRTDTLTAWGDNLVRNAGFVQDGGYWVNGSMLERVASGVPSGAPSDRVYGSLVNKAYMHDRALSGWGHLPVTPGETLDSSVWVGQSAPQPYVVSLLAWCFDASKNAVDLQHIVSYSGGSFTGWKLLQGTWTVPANVLFIVPTFYVEKPEALNGTGQLVCFARPVIQRRAGAALAAQAAVTTEAQARATQDAALASQITTVQGTVANVQASVTSLSSAMVAADTALATRADNLAASNAAGALTADRNALAFAEHWYGPSVQVVAGSVPGRNSFYVGPTRGYVANKRWVAVDAAKTYRISGRYRRGPLASIHYLIVELLDNAGNNISGDGTYWFYPNSAFDPGESWTLGQGLFGAGTARPLPPNAAVMRASALLNYSYAAGTWHQVEDLCIEAADLVRESAALSASVSNLQQAMISGDTAVAQSVTALSARLDNSEGGPNLLPNAGFEVHGGGWPQGWSGYNNAGAANPTTWQIVDGPDGYNACRVSWTGVNTSTKGLYLYPVFPGGFVAGESYIVAVRVRAVSSSALGSLVNLDYANYAFELFQYLRRPPLSSGWQWVVALVKASKPGELYISIENNNGLVNGSFDIAEPIVHTGTIFAGFNLGKDAALAAAVQAANTAQVAGDAALAAQINTVQASVNTVSASVVQESQARATVDGELSAQWSVKVDANGKWAGLQSRSYGNTSYIDMLADVFRVGSASSTPEAFFTVYTVPTQVNGITVQPGVYVRDLFFATLNGGKIVAQSIDTLQLKVGAVTAAQSGFATGNTVSIPAGSFNYTWGYNSIVGLTTTGAPVVLSGHVDIEISLNSTSVATVLLLVSVVDQNGNTLDGVSDITLRPRVVGSGTVGKIRVPVHAYLTGYAAQLLTARLSVQASWRTSADGTLATSGSLAIKSAMALQENKV